MKAQGLNCQYTPLVKGWGSRPLLLVHNFDAFDAAPLTSASGNKLSSLGLEMFNAGEAEDATGLNHSWTKYQLRKAQRSLANIFMVKILPLFTSAPLPSV